MVETQNELKPIVLVGVGEFHYKILNQICDSQQKKRPIVFVSEKKRHIPRRFIPSLLMNFIQLSDVELDFWSLCQKWGVYYLDDECINISREDSTLFLKKYGKLEYHSLSVETSCVPREEAMVESGPSIFRFQDSLQMIKQMKSFFLEVGRHCPRETRVIINGLSTETIDLALAIQHELKKHSQSTEVIVIHSESESLSSKLPEIKLLNQMNIRLLSGASVVSVKNHSVQMSNGARIDFDIFIPFTKWKSVDLLGKIFQREQQQIQVRSDLSLIENPELSIYGDNVFLEKAIYPLRFLSEEEVSKIVFQNIIMDKPESKRVEIKAQVISWRERPYFQRSFSEKLSGKKETEFFHDKWKADVIQEVQKLKIKPQLDLRQIEIKNELIYQAEHMSRPWHGHLTEKKELGQSQMVSFSGFNQWGSVIQSTQKIFECLMLKSFSVGVKPENLRFMLTLPRSKGRLTQSIFESTLKAIEEMASLLKLDLDGGDTFDGQHWRLSLTVSGERQFSVSEKYKTHDYILITRPLGYGLVWSHRTHEQFSSKWVEENGINIHHLQFNHFKKFVDQYNNCVLNMIEEWGFIHHSSQNLTPDQQLMINFREIPRQKGVDVISPLPMTYPALDLNWTRIKKDVAFDRNEVSAINSVLWDPLSQGAMVIGVSARDSMQALEDLKKMGFKQTKVIGCVRPKVNNNKVVLSDWMPQL